MNKIEVIISEETIKLMQSFGFRQTSPGIFLGLWNTIDLTASDQNAENIIRIVLAHIWDNGYEEGKSYIQNNIKNILGL